MKTALLLFIGLECVQGFSLAPQLSALRAQPTAVNHRSPIVMQAEASVSRRQALDVILGSTLALAVTARPLEAGAKATKATAEDTVAAFSKVKAAKENLAKADDLAAKKDYPGLRAFLQGDPYAEIEQSLLILVNGPILNTDDKKTIGTRKRYGIAADVIYGVGGVQGAIDNIENPQLETCSAGVCSGNFVDVDAEVTKSLKSLRASLSEILTVCKAYKELQ